MLRPETLLHGCQWHANTLYKDINGSQLIEIEGKEIIRLFWYFQELVRDSLSDENVFDFL